MKHLVLGLLVSTPFLAQAIDLPTPKVGTTICYSRQYTKQEQHKNAIVKKMKLELTRYKAYPDQLYNSIELTDKAGKVWVTGGGISEQTKTSIRGYGDCDSGQWKLTQDQKDPNKVRLEVDYMNLLSANASEEEGCSGLDLPDRDKVMILYRDTKNCKHVEPSMD